MSTKKSASRPREKGAVGERDWKRMASAGALVAAVLVVLLLGAVLQTKRTARTALPVEEQVVLDHPGEFPEDPPAQQFPSTPPATPSDPLTAPAPAGGGGLAERAGDDRRRLRAPGGDWTLQFLYSCEPANVQAMLDSAGGRDDLYIVSKDDCYRLCWGRYDSRDRAVSARRIVARSTGVADLAIPKPVSEVLR